VVGYSLQSFFKDSSLFFLDTIPTGGIHFLFLEYLPLSLKLLPFLCSFLGFSLGYSLFSVEFSMSLTSWLFSSSPLTRFFTFRLYIDTLYNCIAHWCLTFAGPVLYELFDKGVLEYFGPFGLERLLSWFALAVDRFHNFHLFYYQLVFLYFFFVAQFLGELL